MSTVIGAAPVSGRKQTKPQKVSRKKFMQEAVLTLSDDDDDK